MRKFITILFLISIVLMSQAAQDSTGTSVKNVTINVPGKSSADSTKIKVDETSKDSVASKINAAKTLFKPDSLQKFVDKNGDGYNDNAPDHDGDGIPDALDKDYWAMQDKNKPKPEDGVPPKVYGLDNKPGKIVPGSKPESGMKKPGIKFNRPKPKRRGGRR